MKIILIILLLFISNCKLNKVVKHHGVHFLEKKQEKLLITKSNKNDVIKLLGPPSTSSNFDNDVWIYIERKIEKSSILKLGKRKLKANNVLGHHYNTYAVSSAFCQQTDVATSPTFCGRQSYYPMPEQTFTFSLSRDF